ncbi:uncharacterized protein LOC131427936 [Malaya genurostris]|uniref:uncharacterized protein LOC131427936 n=1 Tax=Malaya genurostris TaxID=325434 RepID=UPI0026F406C4|nr:uncharacterized protein LOC131427936 [Malaya genurostris]
MPSNPIQSKIERMAEKNRQSTKRTLKRANEQRNPEAITSKKVCPERYLREVEAAAAQYTASLKSADESLADNLYAKEIFMNKSNVREVAREMVVSSVKDKNTNAMERIIIKSQNNIYRRFANEPKYRIRETYEKVRFVSPYYEYRFYLALHKPLKSEEEYQDYLNKLKESGMKECWVDMRQRNILLKLEASVVKLLKRRFEFKWSGKLEKITTYLMDAYRSHCQKQEAQLQAIEEQKNLLRTALLKHSNARKRCTDKQIQTILDAEDDLERFISWRWVLFDDDELNKKFHLGAYRTVVPEDIIDISPIEDRLMCQNDSCDSEIVQIQAEMAMTQPSEVIPPRGAILSSKEELIAVLQADSQSLGSVSVPYLPSPTLPEGGSQNQASPPNVALEHQEASVMNRLSPAKSPAECNMNASHSSQQRMLYTLEYVCEFTNIEEVVLSAMRENKKISLEKKMKQMAKYVKKYYEVHKQMFAENKLPPGLRTLTREERNAKKKIVTNEQQNLPSSNNLINVENTIAVNDVVQHATTIAGHSNIVHVDTPNIPRCSLRSRTINYDSENEDDSFESPAYEEHVGLASQSLTEHFLPGVCSTQYEPVVLHPQHAPLTCPNRSSTNSLDVASTVFQQSLRLQQSRDQRQSVDSMSSVDSSVTSVTVVPNTKPTNSRQSASQIKTEKNHSGYENEVECVDIPNEILSIDDSLDAGSSQTDGNMLIDRLTEHDSLLSGVPLMLQDKADALFQENMLSQSSSGSGGKTAILSQEHLADRLGFTK